MPRGLETAVEYYGDKDDDSNNNSSSKIEETISETREAIYEALSNDKNDSDND